MLTQIFGETRIADKIGIRSHPGDQSGREFDLQMVRPKGERLPSYQQATRRADAQDFPHVLGRD
jgi:hypothetical protein